MRSSEACRRIRKRSFLIFLLKPLFQYRNLDTSQPSCSRGPAPPLLRPLLTLPDLSHKKCSTSNEESEWAPSANKGPKSVTTYTGSANHIASLAYWSRLLTPAKYPHAETLPASYFRRWFSLPYAVMGTWVGMGFLFSCDWGTGRYSCQPLCVRGGRVDRKSVV